MINRIRIGTRESKLAVWQAEYVANHLQILGHHTELVFIKTEGDKVLDTPLPLMGGKGVFTKALDDALISGEIDCAVHSFKDVPTTMPDGMQIAAVCERHDPLDALVVRTVVDFYSDRQYEGILATSSNRRKAQWLDRYPNFKISDIRGNVQTRLKKLYASNWDAAIFAVAGLERLDLHDKIAIKLDWMIPAPAQGAVAIASMQNNTEMNVIFKQLNHEETDICTNIERNFLSTLEAGCSAPLGAYARFISDDEIEFKGIVLTEDGSEKIELRETVRTNHVSDFGKKMADEALSLGAERFLS